MFVSVASVKKENDDRMTKCFDKYGIFFAFSNEQLERGLKKLDLKEGEKVSNLGAGMICRTALVEEFVEVFDKLCNENIERVKQKAGVHNIIRYELSNHECYYTGSTEDAVDKLAGYDIKDLKLIESIFREEWAKQDD